MEYSSWDLEKAARRVSRGLSTKVLFRIQKGLGLSNGELAEVVGIPVRTLSRRRTQKILSLTESERTLRIARLMERAVEVLGGAEEGRAWMKRSNYSLNGRTPLEVAMTEPGVEIVRQLLGRIEHGIPL